MRIAGLCVLLTSLALGAPAWAQSDAPASRIALLRALAELGERGRRGELDGSDILKLRGLGKLSDSQALLVYTTLAGHLSSQDERVEAVYALQLCWKTGRTSASTLGYIHLRALSTDGEITFKELEGAAFAMGAAGVHHGLDVLLSLRDDATFAVAFARGGVPPSAPDAPLVAERVGSAVTITGKEPWVAATLEAFDILRATEIGREILSELEKTGRSVSVLETLRDNGFASPKTPAKARLLEGPARNVGSDGAIRFNPYRPGAPATLGHELLHALHFAQGVFRPEERTKGPHYGTMEEELATIGLEEFAVLPLTENKLREQLNALQDPRLGVVFEPRTAHAHEEGTTREAPPAKKPGKAQGAAGRLRGMGRD